MAFKKGHVSWMKGRKHSEETKAKISKANKGKPSSSGSFKLGHKGIKGAGNKVGFKHTKETKKKMSKSTLKGKASPLSTIAKKQVGELHPNWIKDRTKLAKKQERNDSAYKEWRLKIFKRDGFKCKVNNDTCSKGIIAHHIMGWSKFPKLRYEVKNGITLCQHHHPRKRNDERKLASYFKKLITV